jgi:hypothetical protein
MVETLTTLRERCLYADVKENGDPLTPRGLIDPGGLEGAVLLGWAAWIRDEGVKTVGELEATRPAPPTSP